MRNLVGAADEVPTHDHLVERSEAARVVGVDENGGPKYGAGRGAWCMGGCVGVWVSWRRWKGKHCTPISVFSNSDSMLRHQRRALQRLSQRCESFGTSKAAPHVVNATEAS